MKWKFSTLPEGKGKKVTVEARNKYQAEALAVETLTKRNLKNKTKKAVPFRWGLYLMEERPSAKRKPSPKTKKSANTTYRIIPTRMS